MAAGLTLYSDSGFTQALSTGGTLTNPVNLGSILIPATGSTTGTSTQVWYKNTGTTTLSNLSIQATTLTVSGHADGSSEVQVSADNSSWGSSGASQVVNSGTIAPNGTGSFYLRAVVQSTDSPANTSANCPVFNATATANNNG